MARHREFLEGGDPFDPISARVLGPPTRVIPSRPGDELTTPPLGDSRNFVHRRIIGAVGGFISGGPLGAVSGFVRGGAPSPAPGAPGITAVPMRAACPPGFFETPAGGCQAVAPPAASTLGALRQEIGARAFGGDGRPFRTADEGFLPTGTAVMNGAAAPRFGPTRAGGYAPDVREQFYRDCGPGAVLAKDGLCYNRRDLRNNERKWPRGRRPLLTGGEMRAISTAASAAKRLQRKQKQLMSLGLLPKPTRKAAPKQLAPGHHAHVAHDGQSQH